VRLLCRAGFLVLPLVSSLPVDASDGKIEINKARAAAGGVTGSDTPGFPVTIDASGSYILTSNLDVSGQPTPENVTAIVVTANKEVTIDLNGFSIIGPVSCTGGPPVCTPTGGSGIGISATSNNNKLTVKNGTIRGMGVLGIDFAGAAILEDLQLVSNRFSGVIGTGGSSGHALMRNCIVTYNGLSAIILGPGSEVSSCSVGGNGGSGITINNNGQGSVINNNVWNNFGHGIVAGIGILVLGNTVSANGGFGLNAVTSAGYGHNVFNGNNGAGAEVNGGFQIAPNLCNTASCP